MILKGFKTFFKAFDTALHRISLLFCFLFVFLICCSFLFFCFCFFFVLLLFLTQKTKNKKEQRKTKKQTKNAFDTALHLTVCKMFSPYILLNAPKKTTSRSLPKHLAKTPSKPTCAVVFFLVVCLCCSCVSCLFACFLFCLFFCFACCSFCFLYVSYVCVAVFEVS